MISQSRIGESLNTQYAALMQQRGDEHSGIAIWIDDNLVVCAGWDAAKAEAHRARYLNLSATPISPMGETLTVDAASREGLLKVPAGPSNPPVVMLGAGHSLPRSDFVNMMAAWTLRALGMLWVAAGQHVLTN
jgi:hypothetical protein